MSQNWQLSLQDKTQIFFLLAMQPNWLHLGALHIIISGHNKLDLKII